MFGVAELDVRQNNEASRSGRTGSVPASNHWRCRRARNLRGKRAYGHLPVRIDFPDAPSASSIQRDCWNYTVNRQSNGTSWNRCIYGQIFQHNLPERGNDAVYSTGHRSIIFPAVLLGLEDYSPEQ